MQALTPDYLPEIPNDPFTDKPNITYKLNPISFERWQELRNTQEAKASVSFLSDLREGINLWQPFELYYWGENGVDDSLTSAGGFKSPVKTEDNVYW